MISDNITNWLLAKGRTKLYGSKKTVFELLDMYPNIDFETKLTKLYSCFRYMHNHISRKPYREKFGRIVFKTSLQRLYIKAINTTYCEYTGVELSWGGGLRLNRATIDRKDNNKSVLYLKDLCFVTLSANSSKRTNTLRKFKNNLKKKEKKNV